MDLSWMLELNGIVKDVRYRYDVGATILHLLHDICELQLHQACMLHTFVELL